jgi:hypothetical protein
MSLKLRIAMSLKLRIAMSLKLRIAMITAGRNDRPFLFVGYFKTFNLTQRRKDATKTGN